MKKFLISVVAFFVLLAAAGYALISIDWNRFNKEHYYVQITDTPSVEEFVDSKGAVYKSYWYTQAGYNEDGDEQSLNFFAQKELRQDAYLRIYVKDGDVVTSYDEVKFDEMPEAAQKALQQ